MCMICVLVLYSSSVLYLFVLYAIRVVLQLHLALCASLRHHLEHHCTRSPQTVTESIVGRVLRYVLRPVAPSCAHRRIEESSYVCFTVPARQPRPLQSSRTPAWRSTSVAATPSRRGKPWASLLATESAHHTDSS
ncbi:hypothetical protein BCV70DRAFT_18397 [Testicularia cyperi]|uniref:Uncharacterized protein n=1 Tax=Testicularia cyperi TaxID=1882483 RepID=A0A317XYX9_9BASI|nr:hypothetical protein BCV70DRAFT_18397 [Testicularia cyperi]